MSFYELMDLVDNLDGFEEKHCERKVLSYEEYDDGHELVITEEDTNQDFIIYLDD